MVVDDDKEDLNTMQIVLKKQGYDVIAVDNGADALDNLDENKVDLVLIDIKMPIFSGYDLLKLAREKIEDKVPMIYVTIVPEKEVDMREVDGFVQKPFSPESLIAEVKKHV